MVTAIDLHTKPYFAEVKINNPPATVCPLALELTSKRPSAYFVQYPFKFLLGPGAANTSVIGKPLEPSRSGCWARTICHLCDLTDPV